MFEAFGLPGLYQALQRSQLRVLTGSCTVLLTLASVLVEVFRGLAWDSGLRIVVDKLSSSHQDFQEMW